MAKRLSTVGLDMDVLARYLPSIVSPACEACRHARASAGGDLYCVRGGAAYPCEVERESAGVEAWLYGACGRHARFFEPEPAASQGRIEAEPPNRGISTAVR